VYIPKSLHVLATASQAAPGTIVALSGQGIQIATATQDVLLSQLSTLAGKPIAIGELIQQAGLAPGKQLPLPDPALRDRLAQALDLCFPHEHFWVNELRCVQPAELPFPIAEQRLAAAERTPSLAQTIELPPQLAHKASGDMPADLATLLLTAWLVYFQRYNGDAPTIRYSDEQITAIAHGVEPFVAREVPLTISLTDDPSFEEAARRVSRQLSRIKEHRSYPHDLFVRYPDLFGKLQPIPIVVSVGDHAAQMETIDAAALMIVINPTSGQCRLFLGEDLSADGEHRWSAQRTSGHFKQLLSAAIHQPSSPISRLPLLTAQEQAQMLGWNRTDRLFGLPLVAHALFEAQAARAPDALAVDDGEEQLSYQALNAAANRLAHCLRRQGVTTETPVAVALERSTQLLVALLAILKAGGVYLPLDLSLPASRLGFLLADSGATVLLSRRDLLPRLPAFDGTLLSLDDPALTAEEPDHDVSVRISPDQLVYLMYTSGSTGQPKGVGTTHAGLANRLLWSKAAYGMTSADRLLQIAALGFDISVWELLLPVITGGTLLVAPPDRHKDPHALVALLQAEQITTLHCVPSLLEAVLDPLAAVHGATLRQVVCGGETLPVALARRWSERLPQVALHHAYGPTEAAISVTHWTWQPDWTGPRVPLGQPIANTQLYVLDAQGAPVPVGIVGELVIGGVQLARGYLSRPELTADKFRPDPFTNTPGARLYHTGDLGRWLPDGTLEFLGRRDDQIKLRGFRVELGEIEAVLLQHPLVRQAVVAARTEQDYQRLIGYVVGEQGAHAQRAPAHKEQGNKGAGCYAQRVPGEQRNEAQPELDAQELRQFLQERLPDYMVPSAFVVLDALPLTANGKVDRKLLVERTNLSLTEVSDHVIPRNQIGFTLTKIWEQILGVSPIGVHDNFFQLGGHSLFAIRLAGEIQKAFPGNEAINITHIFKYPTIAGLTKLLTAQTVNAAPTPIIPLNNQPSLTPLFLVHPGEGLAFAYHALANRLQGYASYGINNPRFGDPDSRFSSIEEMAHEYIKAVLETRPEGPYWLGGWSFGGSVALEMAHRLDALGHQVEGVLLIDSYNMALVAPEDVGPEGVAQFLNDQGFDPQTDEGRRLRDELLNNGQLAEAYQPKPYHGRVVLIKAAHPDAHMAHVPAELEHGWRDYMCGKLETYTVPGKHAELLAPKYVAHLATIIQEVLDRAAAQAAA
jgi:amino acid adenylation domain-containing protein